MSLFQNSSSLISLVLGRTARTSFLKSMVFNKHGRPVFRFSFSGFSVPAHSAAPGGVRDPPFLTCRILVRAESGCPVFMENRLQADLSREGKCSLAKQRFWRRGPAISRTERLAGIRHLVFFAKRHGEDDRTALQAGCASSGHVLAECGNGFAARVGFADW